MKLVFLIVFLSNPLFAAENESRASIEVIGKAKLNGNLQTWFVNDSTTGNDVQQNFKIRRAELKFGGSVAENTSWYIVVDMAKAIDTSASTKDSKFLQDLAVGFMINPTLEFSIGQMKIPNNWETIRSSGDLIMPERSLLTRTFGDRRDLGATLRYNFGDTGKFAFMVSNGINSAGKSTNVDETNSSKDVNARLEHSGVAIYGGSQVVGDQGMTKQRVIGGFDYVYNVDRWFAALDLESGKDDSVETVGQVLTVGFKFLPKLQLVGRYDRLETKVNSIVTEVSSVSLNWLEFNSNAQVQICYSGLKNAKGNSGSYSVQNNQNGDLVNFAFLAKF
jgi:hypothetical protein